MPTLQISELVALVERDDGRAVIVPRGLEDDPEAQAAGVPYGADWAALKLPPPDALALARELHRRGIFTCADAAQRVPEVRVALMAASWPAVRALFEFIEGGQHE